MSCRVSGEHWRRLLALPVALALAACSGGGTGSPAPPPTTPTGLTSSGITLSSLTLSWTAATDGGGPGIGGYYVYRDGANIATVGATSFADTGLSANTTYQYQVAAFDTSQPTPVASSLSAALGITTAALPPPPPPLGPAAPTGLASSGVNPAGLTLSWIAASATGGRGIGGYYVYRDGVKVATVTSGTSFADTRLIANTAYQYQVAAFDGAATAPLTSALSATLHVVTAPPGPVPLAPPLSVTVSAPAAAVNVAAGGSLQLNAPASGGSEPSVAWQVNGVTGGNAAVGTVTTGGLYTAPTAAGVAVVSAVSTTDQSALGSAQISVLAPHRFAVRTTPTVAEFYDRVSGVAFLPRGNNYVRLAWMTDTQGRYNLVHSTFNVGLYDAQRSEAALASMQANGYNVVTVWLFGCCTGGIGDPSGGLSKGYILNLVDFLTRAKAHGIGVVTASSWLPDIGGYGNYYGPCASQFLDVNLTNLSACGVEAAQIFFHDLVQALVDAGAPMDAIFGYDLWDEYFYNSTIIPLSSTSGTVTAANGQVYDMSDPTSKQRMMDDGVVYFADNVRAAIKALDPTALVTISLFPPQGPNPSRIGDPRPVSAYPSIARSTLDYVDLHMYPVVFDLTMAQTAQNFGFVGYQQKQPIVMGEFGAFMSAYPTISDAAAGLQAWQIQSCAYNIKGWSLWTWDEENAATTIWNATAGDGSINRALGPAFHPDPCAP